MHIMHFIQGESSLDRVLCCFHALHKICHSGNLGWASYMMISEYLPFCPKVWDTNISINQQIQNKTKTGGFWKLLLLASLLPPHCHCNAANPQRCSKSQMPKLKIDSFFPAEHSSELKPETGGALSLSPPFSSLLLFLIGTICLLLEITFCPVNQNIRRQDTHCSFLWYWLIVLARIMLSHDLFQ